MKFYKYKLFNRTLQEYIPGDYYLPEFLAEALDKYKTFYSNIEIEVHQFEIAKVDLVIENEN